MILNASANSVKWLKVMLGLILIIVTKQIKWYWLPSVSCDMLPVALQDQELCNTLFQLFSPKEQNSAIDDAVGIPLQQCWYQWHHITEKMTFHLFYNWWPYGCSDIIDNTVGISKVYIYMWPFSGMLNGLVGSPKPQFILHVPICTKRLQSLPLRYRVRWIQDGKLPDYLASNRSTPTQDTQDNLGHL